MLKRWMLICALLGGTFACGEAEVEDVTEPESSAPTADRSQSADGATETSTVQQAQNGGNFTFIPEYIQIDRLGGGTSADFGDANLYYADPACTPGSDPFDATCDANLPAASMMGATFIDWNELLTAGAGGMNADAGKLAQHRLLDPVKLDSSSFGNDSCVQTTNVLGKMDLTAAAVANNTEYAYLALKRYDNNGDAGYSWVFTKLEPFTDATASGCSQGAPLFYPLSEGDVLVTGNFNPSSGAELIVRRASAAADGITVRASEVVKTDLLTGGQPVWETPVGTTNLAAVNTTFSSAGVFEMIGASDEAANRTDKGAIDTDPSSDSNYAYGPNIFAEAGVDLSVFSGGGSLCGLAFYGSVITQPSSSKTADLKDLLGPELFNFGSLSATGSVSPSCDKEINYQLDSATGPTGNDVSGSVICNWTFTHDATSATKTVLNDCDGTLVLDPAVPGNPGDPTGTWSASLEVSLTGGLACTQTVDAGDVDVFETINVTASTTATCDLSFDYSSVVTGGSGSQTYAWTFAASNGGTPTPTSSTTDSGSVSVSTAGDYTASVTVTDDRTDITCTDTDSDSAHPYAPISVSISPDAASLTCTDPPQDDTTFTSDAITYTATATGGDGNYTFAWTGCSQLAPPNEHQCKVDPSDSDFCAGQDVYVVVDDGSTLCPADTSETETYTKVTIVNSTDN